MEGRNAARYVPLLRTGRWFQGLPEGLQTALVRGAVVRTVAAGEPLFVRGDPPGGLFALVEGRMRIMATTSAGKNVLLALMEPPAWFGEIAVFDGASRNHDAIAETEATLIFVPQSSLDAILEQEPRYWREIGQLLAAKVRLLFGTVADLTALPLGARVARRLLLMAGTYGERDAHSRRVLEVRQEQLAMMHATSRQSINALLREFAARGLVRVAYGQVEILDYDGLQRVAEAREQSGAS